MLRLMDSNIFTRTLFSKLWLLQLSATAPCIDPVI